MNRQRTLTLLRQELTEIKSKHRADVQKMEDLLSQITKWTDKAEKARHEKVIADFMREIGQDLKRMHEIEDIIEPEKVNKQKTAIYGFLESMHMHKIEAARN
jgi:hypothetical protein